MNDNHTTLQMLLTTAVVAAFAALLAGSASAYVMDVEGGGGSGSATVAAQPQVEPGTIPYLSHGIGVDQSLFAGAAVVDELDPAIRTAMQARESSANASSTLAMTPQLRALMAARVGSPSRLASSHPTLPRVSTGHSRAEPANPAMSSICKAPATRV